MEHQIDPAGSIFENAGSFLETKIELMKLKAVDKSSDAFSSMVYILMILMILFTVSVFLGIGIALLLGDAFGEMYYGFFAVGGFYIITGIVLYIFRVQLIKEPFGNLFVKELLN